LGKGAGNWFSHGPCLALIAASSEAVLGQLGG